MVIRSQIVPQICHKKQIENFKYVANVLKFNINKIKNIKKNVICFFDYNQFFLYVFFVGNFSIKKKLDKNVNDIFQIYTNHYKLTKIDLNFQENLNFYINFMKKKKTVNFNNSLLFIDNSFFLPKMLFKNFYGYFNILILYSRFLKTFFNFMHIYIIKYMHFLNTNIVEKIQNINNINN